MSYIWFFTLPLRFISIGMLLRTSLATESVSSDGAKAVFFFDFLAILFLVLCWKYFKNIIQCKLHKLHLEIQKTWLLLCRLGIFFGLKLRKPFCKKKNGNISSHILRCWRVFMQIINHFLQVIAKKVLRADVLFWIKQQQITQICTFAIDQTCHHVKMWVDGKTIQYQLEI